MTCYFPRTKTGVWVVSRAPVLPTEQTWFWSKRWQRWEKQAQADLDEDRVVVYHRVKEALDTLSQVEMLVRRW